MYIQFRKENEEWTDIFYAEKPVGNIRQHNGRFILYIDEHLFYTVMRGKYFPAIICERRMR